MAALIKKRVLAEFTQSQVINEPSVKRKRTLRLTSAVKPGGEGSSASAYIECLNKCKGGNDAMQLLLRISDVLPQMSTEDVPTAVKQLVRHFLVEQESAVRAKIFWVLAELGEMTPEQAEKIRIVNETINLLNNERSHRAKSQGLATLLKLGEYNKPALLKAARQHLPDTWHGVQTRCLSIFGRYLFKSTASEEILTLVSNYTRSQDPRVRAQAFESMAELHSERGCRLPASFFSEACSALQDDYEIVRRAVVKLIWLLGNEYPNKMVPGGDGEDIRMVDCAFSKICSLMGDLSARVRATAMSLLGQMKGVSRRNIEQALDKKHRRGEDENLEVEERSASCGAFIHGLEDEYLEVRTAAVESLCTLSLEENGIAPMSLDFMVDMFNDEIQDVRLRAIESLRKMSKSVILCEDQLETILCALEDFSGEVREGLHATLGASRLATMNCLCICVDRLLGNLSRYPQDKESIRSCLAALGASHPYLTLPLVPRYLDRHPFYDTLEPDVDDPSYASLLVLIFNAAHHCPSMHALFTEHTIKHYQYLRDTMPHFVPRLRRAIVTENSKPQFSKESKKDEVDGDDDDDSQKRSREFLERMVSAVEKAKPGGRVRVQLLEAAAVEIDRLAEMDYRMEGAAKFTTLYIRCLILMKNISQILSAASLTPSMSDALNTANNKISLLLQYSQKLQRLFTGIGETEVHLANDMWLKALAVDLLRVTKTSNVNSMAVVLPLSQKLLQKADALLLSQPDASKLAPFSRSLRIMLPSLVEMSPEMIAEALMPLLLSSCPALAEDEKLPRPSATTRFCHAVIEEPKSETDSALKFTGGLLLGIPMSAKILNLRDPSILRIKLRHPDQQVQLLLPRKSDLKLQNEERMDYRLRTTVLLSHQVWMEACNVEISLALLVPFVATPSCSHSPLDDPCVIDLCRPTKVSIAPKPVKRGM